MHSSDLLPVETRRALLRGERRARLQAMIEGGTIVLIVVSVFALCVTFAWRLQWVSRATLVIACWATAILALASIALASRIRVNRLRLAHRIDVAFDLKDRVRTAVWFSELTSREVGMEAAIADAEAHIARLDARRAFPLAVPKSIRFVPILAFVTMFVAVAQRSAPLAPVATTPPPSPKLVVPADAIASQQREAEQLLAAARKDPLDPESQKRIEDLNRLLTDIAGGKLTKKEAFERLAELERNLESAKTSRPEALDRALKRAAAELAKQKAAKDLAQALAKEDLDGARKELEKLAQEAQRLATAKDERSNQEREALARALDKSADAAAKDSQSDKADAKREAEEQRLREEERRLKKELAQKPNDEELQRKLKKNKRELERLEREKKEAAEQKRELKRLQRELERAAEELRQKLSPEALKELQEQVKQMQNETRKFDQNQRTQMQIAEIKEILRRMGSTQASGGDGKSQQQRDFEKRAGQGKQSLALGEPKPGEGKPSDVLQLGGEGKNGSMILPIPMPAQPGNQPGQPGQGPPGDSDKPGTGSDPNLLGDKTSLDARKQATRVKGKEGAGPSRSETILSSSEKGFSTTTYKRVFSDYTSVMEEVMTKERVPPGYRAYVKRYFELIKPRE